MVIKKCKKCNERYEEYDYLNYSYLCPKCRKAIKKNKNLYSFLIVVIFISVAMIALVQAITLNSGTVLNTTASNSSMTFSTPITADQVEITPTSITLYNVTCYNGTFYTSILWNTPNSNKDSYDSDFCYYVIPSIFAANTSHFELPTDLVSGSDGLFSGLAKWAYRVTGGYFWALMLLSFCIVMFIGTARYSTPRAFGWSSFVGMLGAIFLVIAQLMSWQIGSAFILTGCVGLVVMIMNER